MNKIILIRYGEIALKGNNKSNFESQLISEIKGAIYKLGKFKVTRAQSRIFVHPLGDVNIDEVVEVLKKIFGIVSLSLVDKTENRLDLIKEVALRQANLLIQNGKKTFKVNARRSDKSFELKSPEICNQIGEHILRNNENLSVDVHNPEFVIYIEVRENTYIYSEIINAVGGLPIGTNGKSTLLLSGGIDSPVAGFLLGKRGSEIDAVHFYSYPYTSERAKEKVIELTKIMAKYCGKINLYIVPFTEIQMQIYEKCNDELLTLIMRRVMMQISEKIAISNGSNALITGESLGQVASQTIHALHVTNVAVNMTVFRPLIGLDKIDIINIAQKIGTFETSILPYEDCCTVFVPKHPKTRPNLDKILIEEEKIKIDDLVQRAIEDTEVLHITRWN